MSTHAQRHYKKRMIQAASSREVIRCDVEAVEWVQAAEADAPADGSKRFKMRAYTGGPIQVGYYGAPVVIDMAGLKAAAPLPILLNHDPEKIVGHADELTAGDSTLDLAGVMSGGGPESAQVMASAKLGFPWKASVGARPDKMEFLAEGTTAKVNGKTVTGPVYVARKSTLGEVSFVAMAADPKTSAKVAAIAAFSHPKEPNMDFEKWIAAKGFDPEALTEDGKVALRAAYDAEHKTTEPPTQPTVKADPTPAETIRAEAAAEATRIAEIRKVADKFPDIQAKAIAEGWEPVRAELEVVRAERPKAPAVQSSTRDTPNEVIQAAFCRTAGLQNLEKHFKPETLEASDKFRGFGLQELLLSYAVQGGYTGRHRIHSGNVKEAIQAAFSVHSLTTLLTTTGNKFLLDGFNSMPQSWRSIASTRPVNDFKTVTAYRMTAELEYKELPPGGEIHHGTVGQESYTMSAKTYARMLALTRNDIINDDLGAFNDVRNRLGIGAAIKMNKVFWTAFLTASNAGVFWSATHANLVTSSSLAEAGLNTAVAAFRDMAGPDGNMMNLEPRILLVPTALEATALKIYNSQEIRDTTASTKFFTTNIYQNRFRPIPIPELGNSAYTGYSATTWFLMADPSVMACAVMCFLNGQEAPTIESADTDFDTLGIQFRGYHDFGCAMTEYRCTVKATA
jgi:phage major head subunit gpT-like protein